MVAFGYLAVLLFLVLLVASLPRIMACKQAK